MRICLVPVASMASLIFLACSPSQLTSDQKGADNSSANSAPAGESASRTMASGIEMPQPAPHSDHDAAHGGTFFMSADGTHHIEGAYPRPGRFELYLYDDRKRALPPSSIVGYLQVDMDPAARSIPLQSDSSCECLSVIIRPAPEPPVRLTVRVRIRRLEGGPGEEQLYNFEFSPLPAQK